MCATRVRATQRAWDIRIGIAMITIVEEWHIAKARAFPELHVVFHLINRIERKRYPLREYIVRQILIHYFATPAHLLRLNVIAPLMVVLEPTLRLAVRIPANPGALLVTISPPLVIVIVRRIIVLVPV